jgi:hypothetical protein
MADRDPTVIGLVTAGLTEVKEAVTQLSRDLHSTLARLPNEYVPRREAERRLDELTLDLAAERLARERAIQSLTEAHEQGDAERRATRRVVYPVAVGSGISLLGVLSGIYLHFH